MVRHVLDEKGNHWLEDGTKQGQKASYMAIARLGEVYAVTDYYEGFFPEVFRVVAEVDSETDKVVK
jgi:hypothetical protein